MNTAIATHPTNEITFHRLLSGLPRWEDDSAELRQLSEDIAARGIDQPLICCETEAGKPCPGELYLIDGRHRLLAAQVAGLAEVPVIVRPEEEAPAIILHSLIERRHYTKSALAYVSFPLLDRLTEQGIARRSENLRDGSNFRKSTKCTFGESTLEDEVERLGVCRRLFFQAKELHRKFAERPDLRAKYEPLILSGALSLGYAINGIAGEEATKGKSRKDGAQLDLFVMDRIKAVDLAFSRWDRLEKADRARLADQFVDRLVKWPAEVQQAAFVALAARQQGRAL